MSDMLAWQTPNLDWQSEFAVCQASRRGKQEVLFHSKIKQGSQNYCYRYYCYYYFYYYYYYYYYYYFSYYYYCPYVLLGGSFKLFFSLFSGQDPGRNCKQ